MMAVTARALAGTGSLDPALVFDQSDRDLMERSCGGDQEAFARLYARYRKPIFNACVSHLHDPTLAEDVVQETFLRAYTHLDNFNTSKRVFPWLLSIAIRRCIDIHRRESRTEVGDPIEAGWEETPEGDATLDTVIADEDRRVLETALQHLPWRQRRALLLYAVEGWSYSDIAAAEGLSLQSTKSLLFRARLTLRHACETGALGLVMLPLRRLRTRATMASARLRARLGLPAELALGRAGDGLTAACALLAALSAGVATPPAAPPSVARVALNAPTSLSGAAGRKAPPRTTITDTPRALSRDLLDPTGDATPERTHFTSFAASPAYGNDRTVFAAGEVPCQQQRCPVLFVSRDAGASWTRTGEGFLGHTLLISPGFPEDPRIFSMGPGGLQVSVDRGETFQLVNPLSGEAAISPAFGSGDPRIIVGGTAVMEYNADLGVIRPAALLGARGPYTTVAFSAGYETDDTLFLGTIGVENGAFRSMVHRCGGSLCDAYALPGSVDAPRVRVAPDGRVYAFTAAALFGSNEGQDYTELKGPWNRGALRDVAVTDASIYAASMHGIWRSEDLGASWVNIGTTLMASGADVVALLPDRRVLAGRAGIGIGCSTTQGARWETRC